MSKSVSFLLGSGWSSHSLHSLPQIQPNRLVYSLLHFAFSKLQLLCHSQLNLISGNWSLPQFISSFRSTKVWHRLQTAWGLGLCPSLESPQVRPLVVMRIRACCCFCRVRIFATLWTTAHQAPLSMGLSRQEYWRGLPCRPPWDLSDPGIQPAFLISPSLAGRFFTTSAIWEAQVAYQ